MAQAELPGKITPQVFDHLVKLAEFELAAEEGEYLRRELNGQLKAIRELEAIEVDLDVPITSHGVPYPPGTSSTQRADVAETSDEAEAILAQAPEVDGRYIVVPDIPHTELD